MMSDYTGTITQETGNTVRVRLDGLTVSGGTTLDQNTGVLTVIGVTTNNGTINP